MANLRVKATVTGPDEIEIPLVRADVHKFSNMFSNNFVSYGCHFIYSNAHNFTLYLSHRYDFFRVNFFIFYNKATNFYAWWKKLIRG